MLEKLWPPLVRETLHAFSSRGGRLLGGAIAFYALLSVAPMLLIAVHLAGVLTGREAARAALVADLARWIGRDGAHTLAEILDRAEHAPSGALSTVLGAVLLAYASTRLFSALEYALHHMWDVQAKTGRGLKGKAWKQLRKRALGFAMVLLVGATLVLLVAIKTTLAAVGKLLPIEIPFAWHAVEALASFAIATGLFAAVFRILPDVRMAARDLLVGALATAAMFSVGTTLIGLWIGRKGVASTWGAAGSMVMLLLWVHYCAQIFFLGASFTGVWARRRGRRIEPNEHAVRVLVEHDEV